MRDEGDTGAQRRGRPDVRGGAQAQWAAVVRRIIAAAESGDLHELEVRRGTFRVALRRARDPDSPIGQVAPRPASDAPDTGIGIPRGWHVLEAPLAGIWYDAPSPGAAPYVSVGDAVAPGTVVGLVETMKVFNEVTADVAGIVRQVLAQRGDLVAAHAPLMAIEPTGAPGPNLGSMT